MVLPERLEKMSVEEFRAEVTDWIRMHYGKTLGAQVNLLKQENGFDLLRGRVRGMLREKGLCKDEMEHKAA